VALASANPVEPIPRATISVSDLPEPNVAYCCLEELLVRMRGVKISAQENDELVFTSSEVGAEHRKGKLRQINVSLLPTENQIVL
jgi:hypothetical protein